MPWVERVWQPACRSCPGVRDTYFPLTTQNRAVSTPQHRVRTIRTVEGRSTDVERSRSAPRGDTVRAAGGGVAAADRGRARGVDPQAGPTARGGRQHVVDRLLRPSRRRDDRLRPADRAVGRTDRPVRRGPGHPGRGLCRSRHGPPGRSRRSSVAGVAIGHPPARRDPVDGARPRRRPARQGPSQLAEEDRCRARSDRGDRSTAGPRRTVRARSASRSSCGRQRRRAGRPPTPLARPALSDLADLLDRPHPLHRLPAPGPRDHARGSDVRRGRGLLHESASSRSVPI